MKKTIRITQRDRARWQAMSQPLEELTAEGYSRIAGVDEAGRGPLAGPVVAAACILDPRVSFYGLNDSKKMTPARRDALYEQIVRSDSIFATALVSAEEIDRTNILRATRLAMRKALLALEPAPDYVLLDAVMLPDLPWPAEALIQGDAKANCIAAASVLAKVTRDRLMIEADRHYPGYGFAAHKGYGTSGHRQALLTLGACPIHRVSFLGNILNKPAAVRGNQRGSQAEDRVIAHLQAQGYRLLARNVRLQDLGELDLIFEKKRQLYLVEVKVRQQHVPGTPLQAAQTGRIRRVFAAWQQQNQRAEQDVVFMLADVRLNTQGEVLAIRFTEVD